MIFKGYLGSRLPAGTSLTRSWRRARARRRQRLRRPAAALARRPRRRHRLRRARPRAARGRSRVYVAAGVLFAGCRATCSTAPCRTPCAQLRARRRGRSCNRAAAALRRLAAARRAAQPRHERHRQRRAVAAADAEPAAHVAADGDRRRHGDVRDLAAARGDRAGHDPGDDAASRRRSRKRSQPKFIAQWKATGRLNAHIEESVLRPRARAGVRPPARESRSTFARTNDELFQASFGAQFISGMIMPAMMFIGNLNYVVIAVVGGLRVASGIDVARRRPGLHPVLAPVHPAADPDRVDGEPAAVGRGVRRAGVRPARRAGAVARPGRSAGARRSAAAGSSSSTSASATSRTSR